MRVINQPVIRGVSSGAPVSDRLPKGMFSLDMWVGPSSMSYRGQLNSVSDEVVVGAPKVDWAKRRVTITIDVKQQGGVGLPAIGDFEGTVPLPMLIGRGRYEVVLTDKAGKALRVATFNN